MRQSVRNATLFLVVHCAVATHASAQVNLAWNNCIASATSSVDKAWTCDMNEGTPFRLVGSFIAPTDMSQLVAITMVVDLCGMVGWLPSWWQMGPGQCRDGSLTVASNLPGLSALCAHPFPNGANWSEVSYRVGYGGWNTARIVATLAVDAPVAIQAGGHYYAGAFLMDRARTVIGDAGESACAGCQNDVCLVLNSVELYQTEGALPVDRWVMSHAATRNMSTWQGGTVGTPPCGFVVSAENRTWGAIKAIYR